MQQQKLPLSQLALTGFPKASLRTSSICVDILSALSKIRLAQVAPALLPTIIIIIIVVIILVIVIIIIVIIITIIILIIIIVRIIIRNVVARGACTDVCSNDRQSLAVPPPPPPIDLPASLNLAQAGLDLNF